MRRNRLTLGVLLVTVALVAAACSSGEGPSAGAEKGGTFRIQADELPWQGSGGGFDPVIEYYQVTFSMFSDLLMRPLMNYNHLSAAKGGNVPLPDLASGAPTVAEGGTKYTYKLKSGVKFAPPVNRDVTSKDVAYAFERLGTAAISSAAGGYSNYYLGLIKGMQDFNDKKATTISGITTPDDSTIVFELTKAAGDFDFRVAMPATGPVPREVASCFTQALEYGQYFVSSGPYMIEGSDKLDISSCDKLKAAKPSGFDFEKHMFLVRNPSYDASTDSKDVRSALPDRFEITLNTNADDIYAKIEAGEVDYGIAAVPPAVLQKYSTTDALKPFLHVEPDDSVWYLTMNLTEPPFDDVHVRKAANFIMDKQALIRAIGGSLKGIPAEHIIPPDILQGRLAVGEFDPYASPNHAGDLEKAKAEMKQSKYDANGDGICEAAACKNVTHVTRNTPPFPDMAPFIEASMKKIGIELKTVEVASFYGEAGTPSKKVPFTSGAGWGKDWADAITYVEPLFTAKGVGDAGNVNLSLVGLGKDQATKLKTSYPADGVPNVDADVTACTALSGSERLDCWANLDKKIMNEIAPWIPWRWSRATHIVSEAVTNWTFDAFATFPSFAHMGVDPAKQK